MPSNLTRPLLPILALLALTLLTPTLATALPQGATIRSAAERPEGAPGLFAKLWNLLSVIWATGPGLEPNGATGSGSGTDPNAGTNGDNGPGLDPDG